jgi:hypothetical protein
MPTQFTHLSPKSPNFGSLLPMTPLMTGPGGTGKHQGSRAQAWALLLQARKPQVWKNTAVQHG